MNPIRFRKVLGDVSREFDHPRAILGSDDLTAEQKIRLLKEWELDLRGLQVAAEENMADENNSDATTELLQECRRALMRLEGGDGDSGGAPTKTGAGA
ncbi:MAG: hypothetical protein AB7S71_07415 [Dongiaceae bacterium]